MKDDHVATRVRRRVLSSRDRFWRPEDFDGSSATVSKALSRLEAAGDLRRVRRGLYWRGTDTPLGMAPPPPDRFVAELSPSNGVGPSGLSAALALGLSTQVPRRRTTAIPSRVPRSVGANVLVSRAAATKRRDERLRPEEVALFEVLRDWDHLVEVPEEAALERLGGLLGDGILRSNRLTRASSTEPARVREGLRRVLAGTGHTHDAARVRPARSGGLVSPAV